MVLIVNGQKVEETMIQNEAERMRPEYERAFADMDHEQREEQLRQWSRENVIERVLIEQEARRRGYEVSPKEVDSAFEQIQKEQGEQAGGGDAEKLKETIATQMRIERMLQEVSKAGGEPSEEQMQQYYQEHKAEYKSPERIRVAHIVKHINWQASEEEARKTIEQAKREIEEGTGFESLVGKYSDCPENGGDLGYIARGEMVEEFDDVVFNLGSGQLSEIFHTRFGYHIAKVYDRKPASVAGFDEVKDKVMEGVHKEMESQAIDRFIDKLRENAEIKDSQGQ